MERGINKLMLVVVIGLLTPLGMGAVAAAAPPEAHIASSVAPLAAPSLSRALPVAQLRVAGYALKSLFARHWTFAPPITLYVRGNLALSRATTAPALPANPRPFYHSAGAGGLPLLHLLIVDDDYLQSSPTFPLLVSPHAIIMPPDWA